MTFEVGYFVDDAGAAAAFYVENLDCVELARMTLPTAITEPTGLGGPTTLVALKAPNGMTLKFLESGGGFGRSTTPDSHDHYLTFYTSTFDDTSERLVAAGATPVTKDPAQIPSDLGGGRMRFLIDPHGNGIELIEGRSQV